MTSRCIATAVALLTSLVACSTPPPKPPARVEPAQLGAIKPIHKHGLVYLAGQPSAADLEAAKAQGVKTVLNLRKKDEPVAFDEAATVAGLGIEYLSLPFGTPEELTDGVFTQARGVLSNSAKRPLLLHCASANRVGAVWLAHRVLDQQVPYADALAEAKEVGLKSAPYEQRALEYIQSQSAKK